MRTRSVYRTSVALALSLALGFTSGCSRDPNKQKQKYLESGKRYADEGKYKEAVIQISNALKVDHNFAAAHYELAKVYLKQGSMLPGYAELMRTIDLQPGNLQARIDLGSLLLAANETQRATDQANAVLAAQSNNADAHALLSSIALRKGDRAEALNQIQRALAIDPNRASFHSALGLIQSGDAATTASGEAELRKAIALDNKNLGAHLILASLLNKKGDTAGAQEQLKQAIAADPKNVMARVTLANSYQHQGNGAKAEETLHQATDDLADTKLGADLLADYLIGTHQLDRADSAYTELVSKHPKSPYLKVAYARILIMKKDLPKARTVIADVTKTDSTLPEVGILNAMLQLNDGKVNDAFNTLQKSAKSNPDSIQVKIWLGRAAQAKGDLSTAQQSFRDATKLNSRNMEAQEGLAQTSIALRDFNTLSQVADSTISIAPQSSIPYLWRGFVEVNRKEFDKADADFKTAIKNDPKNPNGYFELAQLRLAQKQVPEAQPLLEQTLTANPNSVAALRLLVSTYLYQKQPAKALARVQEQTAKVPQNSGVYDILSDLQLQTHDVSASLASAQKALQLNPNDGMAMMAFTRAQLSQGDPAKAADNWQQWIKSHPTDAGAYTILGTIQEAQGNRDPAIASYKKALEIQPEQPVAANNLAYLMVETGQNSDVALSLAQIARRAMPDSSNTADTLGWVYYQKGNYSSARDLFEDALKTAPNSAAIHYHLGMTYSKLSNSADAITHLKKAVSLAPDSQTGKDAAKALSQLG